MDLFHSSKMLKSNIQMNIISSEYYLHENYINSFFRAISELQKLKYMFDGSALYILNVSI